MNAPTSVVELLQALIRIPSVNPHGDPGIEAVGEKQLAEWLAIFLESIGAEVELREVLPDRPNVVARWRADRPGKPKLLFAPHTDTVSVEGMSIDPFGAELRDGKIWGRGASDTKGSMAAMLWALRGFRGRLGGLGHEIWFAGLMSEETSQHGSRALASEERFDFVIAGEPTGLDVVHTHKGSAFLNLVTHGTAGHASRPDPGGNAIDKMHDVLGIVRTELAAEFAAQRHPLLGHSTLSIGTIHGGTKTNIIPDRCTASVDLRFVPAHYRATIIDEIAARLRRVCPDLEVSAIPAPPLQTDPAHPLIAKLEACGARPVGAPWFCDACYFAERGMPAVAIGPGSIEQAHTRDEWIAVEELERGADFFARFLERL
ncbi:MAG: succinyl-diaminopimelate desuccinylase [Chthoniobacter sp.]|jgi:acetylornithine deacetylase/succinyl-diaminopimelate desuccinylase-like protein|nr:succinyl-diaminopimelate desuccinylase [Chthoniobacter sp.]